MPFEISVSSHRISIFLLMIPSPATDTQIAVSNSAEKLKGGELSESFDPLVSRRLANTAMKVVVFASELNFPSEQRFSSVFDKFLRR